MTAQEIMTLVNRYIGVTDGYLVGYSFRKHQEFYPLFCDLNIDPLTIEGSTRSRFVNILKAAEPIDQAKIIRGAIAKAESDGSKYPSRTPELNSELLVIARRLESGAPVNSPNPKLTSEVVNRAIADAESLLTTQDATSGVDRLHTTLHGYLKVVCLSAGIAFADDATMTNLFKLIRQQHPSFLDLGPRADDITRVINSMANIMDALNPLRNRRSLAHPNDELLDAHEAMLVVNSARTILHYLDAKIA